MKICHITSEHPSDDIRVFLKMCTSLAREGHEVYLVAPGESREENGVYVIGVGTIADTPRGLFRIKLYRKAIEVDAQIYHLHDMDLLPYWKMLKRRGKKVIYDIHEDEMTMSQERMYLYQSLPPHKWFYKLFINKLTRRFKPYDRFVTKIHPRLFHRYLYHRCKAMDALICVTPGGMYEDFKKINDNTVIITNYPMLNDEILKKVPDFESNKIIFAGAIKYLWNHELIIQALERIPDSKYIVCGSSYEKYQQMLEQLPGWKQVELKGVIPHAQVMSLLPSAAAGIIVADYQANLRWNYGSLGVNKIFEYMMAGLPIICTDFVLWRKLIDEYKCGICVNPDSVDDIEKAIRFIFEHPEEARVMGENGRRAIIEKFNWNIECEKLLKLYESVEGNSQ